MKEKTRKKENASGRRRKVLRLMKNEVFTILKIYIVAREKCARLKYELLVLNAYILRWEIEHFICFFFFLRTRA